MIGDLDDMRFSLATASCAVVIGALLAGCSSTTQGGSNLPTAFSPTGQHQAVPQGLGNHKISPEKLLALQAGGKVAGPATRGALERMLKELKNKPDFKIHGDSKKAVAWTNDTDYGYIIGVTKKGKAVSDFNVTEYDGCYYPITLKVDSSQNIWGSCEESSSFSGSSYQEYTKTGTLTSSYSWSVPCSYSEGCEFSYGYGFDGASNANDVFSSETYGYQYICTSYDDCNYYYQVGFYWWPKGSPSASPTFISLPYGTVDDVYYMDLDANGNIWFDYEGEYGVGIGEVTSPTTNPQFVNVIPSSGIEFPGGVYASNGGHTLNVTDQETRITTQYSISGSTLAEIGTIGPTKTNIEDQGDPVSGGFNKADTTMGFGDAYGWDDTCTTSSVCKILASPNYPEGAEGFAYSPSDK